MPCSKCRHRPGGCAACGSNRRDPAAPSNSGNDREGRGTNNQHGGESALAKSISKPLKDLLGEARFSGTLEREANKSEEVARKAVVQLGEKLADYKKLSVAARARESVLQKQAIGLSVEVSTLQEASEFAESRCEARLRSLREELEGQQETLKNVLVGMVRQLGLEGRVAGNMLPIPTHHAPRPPREWSR